MRILIKIIIFLVLIPSKSYSLIEVDITRGNLDPLPIAVSPLSIDENSRKNFEKILKKKNIGAEISKIIEVNLKTSGLFNPLNKDAFLQAPDIANLKPRFEDWNLIKAQALITGKVSFIEEKLRVEFRLWDVLAGKEMVALAFTTVPTNWRRVGHIITDKVYQRQLPSCHQGASLKEVVHWDEGRNRCVHGALPVYGRCALCGGRSRRCCSADDQ